jgi:hypothetical protein
MPDLADGESTEMKGSGAKPYVLKNTGGVYSCSCPAWRNQSITTEKRTCKHLRKLRGDAAEEARIGGALPSKPVKAKADSEEGDDAAGPGLLLAHSWDNAADLSGWWMSEKLDGVRAYWDDKQFLSRQGNLYHAPDWFIEHLPTTPLDLPPSQLFSPLNIAVDSQGRIYVSDAGSCIKVYDKDGNYIAKFGGHEVAFGIAIDDDKIYACMRNRHTVRKYVIAKR